MNVFEEIGSPQNKNTVIYFNGDNENIVSTIHKSFSRAVAETKGIAQQFKGKNNLETSYAIWDFLRSKINYKADKGTKQQIRLPKRFLADRTGDCKSFSLFTASILYNLDIPFAFRYVSYSGVTPTHVYVVAEDEQRNPIIIDGVWSRFDDEKKYKYKYDYKMRIETLTGTDDPISGLKLKDAFNKVVGTVKKVNPLYVVGRNAFLGLVRLNVRGFATRIATAISKNATLAKKVWEQTLGGDYGSLVNAVNAGKTKKAILPPKNLKGIGDGGATAAAIVAAAPIILVIVNALLKPMGQGDDPMITDAVSDAELSMEEPAPDDATLNDLSKNGLNSPWYKDPIVLLLGAAGIGGLVFALKGNK